MNLEGNETVLASANNYITEDVRCALGAQIFPAGSIVFPKVGGAIATNKKRQVVRPSCVDNNVMGLIPDESFVDREYLRHWMQGQDIYAFSNKANPPSITQSTVRAWPFLLPPLEEQKRIVAVLDQAFAALDHARANAEANLADADALADASLTAVFHRRGPGWRIRKLRDLCERITVGHVGPMAQRYEPQGIPFLRSQNIRPFEINLEDVKFIGEKFDEELNKSRLTPGDVVIVRTGFPGTAAVIPEGLRPANCADLVIVRPRSAVSSHFLAMFFNSSFGRGMVAANAVGAAQKHFNVGSAKNVDFPFPPIEEQEQIVRRAAALRAYTRQVAGNFAATLSDLAALRQSLLQKAFAGELA